MKLAFHCGLSVSEYEEMTPAELNILSEVKADKMEQSFHEKITVAWFTEYYHRQETLPSLQECLDELKPDEPMTDDDMLAMVKKLNAQFGGKVVEGEEMAKTEEGE